MKPYKNQPDVLDLVIHKSQLKKFEVKRVEYPWGLSKIEYCYYRDVLIGSILDEASNSKTYYKGLKVEFQDRLALKLVPLVDKDVYLLCPTYAEFSTSLSQFLNEAVEWDLICEADCEQHLVDEVPNIHSSINEKLSELGGFCNGETYQCPTFIVRSKT